MKLPMQDIKETAGSTDRKFGTNGFYASAAATEQYEEFKITFAALERTLIKNNFSLKPMVSLLNDKLDILV